MKACIFDLDGTLTNTLESMTYSVNLTLKEMGLSRDHKGSVQNVCRKRSKSSDGRISESVGDPKASRIEEGMKIYGRIFDQNCTYHVTLYEGISEMLKSIERNRSEYLAVLSNKPHCQTVKVVKKSMEIRFLTMHRDKKMASAENQIRTECFMWRDSGVE